MKWNSFLMSIKRLFCRHDFEQIAWRESIDGGVRYSERLYKCTKCGKEAWIDGRNDPYIPKDRRIYARRDWK